MIAHIQGKIVEQFAKCDIIDDHGVGYEVALSSINFDNLNLNDEVKVYTYHLVREQSEELFGFTSLAEKKLFELLISVQGVGPKNAMSILSLAPAEEVRNAIANADAAFIAKASGIGKRSSERVIVDLKEKVGLPTHYGRTVEPQTSALPINDEALEALMALGFQLADATRALDGIDQNLPIEERIRLALKSRN